MKEPSRIGRKTDITRSGAQSKPAPVAQRHAAVTTTLRETAGIPQGIQRPRRPRTSVSAEWKIARVRETPSPHVDYDRPEKVVDYWHASIATAPNFSPEVEWLAVVVLNTKLHVLGHFIVSQGTMNESMAHPREVFRAAIIGGAYAIVLMHNHPSGDPCPSDADRELTRRLIESAALLQISLIDHVIIGTPAVGRLPYFSFAEAGMMDRDCGVEAPRSPAKRDERTRAATLARSEASAITAGLKPRMIQLLKKAGDATGLGPEILLSLAGCERLKHTARREKPGCQADSVACVAESPREKEETIIVEMPTELHDAVMKACKAKGITAFEFFRLAVRERLDRLHLERATSLEPA